MQAESFHHGLDRFPHRPISPIWMIMYIFSSVCFFVKLNRLIKANTSCETTWMRRNILLSFTHALICSALIAIGVIRAPEMLEDPLSYSNHFNYALLAFSVGYFLFDFLDCLRNSNLPAAAILVHHVFVIIFFTQVLYHTRNLGYAMYGLSTEINSVFLHARRLVRWYSPITASDYYNNLIKTLVDIGNYVTFILFRIGSVTVGLRALYIQRNRMHPVVHTLTVVVVLMIAFLNLVLFYRLIRREVFGQSKAKLESQEIVGVNK